jgi:hypothetical protein
MDLRKLDPMARKMRVHVDGFYKAIEDNDSYNAGNHINEILKFAEYMSKDVNTIIAKSDYSPTGINDIYAGGAPVRKLNSVEKVHEHSNDVLAGTIRTSRYGKLMRPQSNRSLQ